MIPPSLPAGVAFQLDYSAPTQLVLELVTPTTQNFLFPTTFSTFGTAANWSPAGVPGTTSSAYIINTAAASKTVTVSSSDTLYRLDLQGTVGSVDMEITSGVTLATSNQLIVDTGATMNVQNGGIVIANGGLAGAGATTVSAGGSLTAMSLRQAQLTINGILKVPIVTPRNSSQTVSVVGQINIAGFAGNWTGSLDLGNSDLDVTGGSLATLTDQIRMGYNVPGGGDWAGRGISSSAAAADPTHLTALGIIQNNQGGSPLFTSIHPFDGITPGAADTLIKYTYYGDATLDGKVDGSDYVRIDNGYLNRLSGWYNGDFNYDGVVDGSDYALIDNSFNTQRAQLSAEIADPNAQIAKSPAAVPEPASLAMIGIGVMGLYSRRRRQRSDGARYDQ